MRHGILERSDLKPGVWLQNIRSKRLGKVAGQGGRILEAHDDYVVVHVRCPREGLKPKYERAVWNLPNLRIAPPDLIPKV